MMFIPENVGFQLEEAKRFILEEDDFLVVSHVQPDGDAASSTMAMGLILMQLNKTFTMINEDKIPMKFQYLFGFEQIKHASDMHDQARRYQNIITVDCADYSRIGTVQSLFNENPTILNIDHHPTNDQFGRIPLIQVEAAATVEILFQIVEALGLKWNKELAYPTVNTASYSLGKSCKYSTIRVARPMQRGSTPVTAGSNVPVCPILFILRIRLILATTSCEVQFTGL